MRLYIPHFLYPFIHLGWFHSLAIVNRAAKIWLCSFLYYMLTYVPLDICPGTTFMILLFVERGSHYLFAWSDLKMLSSWSQLVWITATGPQAVCKLLGKSFRDQWHNVDVLISLSGWRHSILSLLFPSGIYHSFSYFDHIAGTSV
jgi:hypothetical protein